MSNLYVITSQKNKGNLETSAYFKATFFRAKIELPKNSKSLMTQPLMSPKKNG